MMVKEKTISNNKRIARNTGLLYFRMLLVMIVTFYTTRVVLDALGVVDYGIYNVVGGVVAMLTFLNSTLSSTCQRYFSYELGRDNKEGLSKLFKLNFSVYIIFIIIILLFAETIGLWFVNNKLDKIPIDRLCATNWVYQFTIFTIIATSISVPYNALIISHEKMDIYAYITIVEVLMKLGVAMSLSFCSSDKLVFYAFLMLLSHVLVTLFYYLYCRRKYPESRFSFYWDRVRFKEIVSYSGWHLIGAISVMIRNQGVNVLLGTFFMPVVNAARGIAFQVMTAVDSLTNSFFTAAKPQIYKYYGSGEINKMHHLVCWSSKLCYYLVAILAFPILFNTQMVLSLWVKVVPDYAVLFTQLVLINAIIDSLNGPSIAAALATGKIRNFEIITGGLMILNLPVSYVFLRLGWAPEITMYVSIAISLLTIVVRAFIIERLVGLTVRVFMNKVMLPLLLISALTPVLPYLAVGYISSNEWINLAVSSLLCIVTLTVLMFFLAFSAADREKVISFISNRVKR